MMLISRQFGLMGNENIWAWLLHEPVDIFSIIFWQNLPGNNDCFYFWEPCNFPSLSTLKPFVHLPIRIKRICCDDDGVRASSNPISSLQCYPICSLFRVAFYTQWYSTANSWIPLMRISLKVADFISKEFTQWLEFLALAAKFSSTSMLQLGKSWEKWSCRNWHDWGIGWKCIKLPFLLDNWIWILRRIHTVWKLTKKGSILM